MEIEDSLPVMQKTWLAKISEERTCTVETKMSHIVYISIHSILSHFAIPYLTLLTREVAKPAKTTRRCAQTATRQGKLPATQAVNMYVKKCIKPRRKERGAIQNAGCRHWTYQSSPGRVKLRKKHALSERTHFLPALLRSQQCKRFIFLTSLGRLPCIKTITP